MDQRHAPHAVDAECCCGHGHPDSNTGRSDPFTQDLLSIHQRAPQLRNPHQAFARLWPTSVGANIDSAPALTDGALCEPRKRHHVDNVIDAIAAVPWVTFPRIMAGESQRALIGPNWALAPSVRVVGRERSRAPDPVVLRAVWRCLAPGLTKAKLRHSRPAPNVSPEGSSRHPATLGSWLKRALVSCCFAG